MRAKVLGDVEICISDATTNTTAKAATNAATNAAANTMATIGDGNNDYGGGMHPIIGIS